jgi:hypothetical protein
LLLAGAVARVGLTPLEGAAFSRRTPIPAAIRKPPASVSTIAEHHNVAAVLRPWTLTPSRKITPAPRKPMPETI